MTAKEKYLKVMKSAQKEYDRIVESAEEVLKGEKRLAREKYCSIEKSAHEKFNKIKELALEEYEKEIRKSAKRRSKDVLPHLRSA